MSAFIQTSKLPAAPLRENKAVDVLIIEGEKSNEILDRNLAPQKSQQSSGAPLKRISITTHGLESKEERERREKEAQIIEERKAKKQKK